MPHTAPPNPNASIEQIDQRVEFRREWDRRVIALLITAVTISISIGVAWGTATSALAQKVDKADQALIDAAQDRHVERIDARTDGLLKAVQGIQVGVDSANLRLRQIACDGQKASCR